VIFAGIFLSLRFSPLIYDLFIVHMTSLWYREVLLKCEVNWKLLDVGIGTGTSLCRNSSVIHDRQIQIIGIDINQNYINFCRGALKKAGLSDSIAHCISIFDENLPQVVGTEFDAVYFSGSISLMPQPDKALKIAAGLLKDGGKLFVTQTFQRKDFPFLRILKPLLRYLTTIDFGKLTFEKEFDEIVAKSGLTLIEKSLISGSVNNPFQAAFIFILTNQ